MSESFQSQPFKSLWSDAKQRISHKVEDERSVSVNRLIRELAAREQNKDSGSQVVANHQTNASVVSFPELSREQAQWANLLVRLHEPLRKMLDGDAVEISIQPIAADMEVHTDKALEFSVVGETAWVKFNIWPFQPGTDDFSDVEIWLVPDELRDALIKQRFGPYLRLLQKTFGVKVESLGLLDSIDTAEMPFLAQVTIDSVSRGRMDFYFGLPRSLAGLTGAVLDQVPVTTNPTIEALSVATPLEIGFSWVTLQELQGLSCDDLIFCSRFSSNNEWLYRARFTPAFHVYCAPEEGGDVMRYLGSQEQGAISQDFAESFQDLRMEVTFSLGEVRMPFSELRKVQPGYTVQTSRRQDELIDIRVNGQKIGIGELVDIDGRAGIKIIEIFGSHGKSA